MNNAFAPVLAALLALSTAFVPGPAAAQATTPMDKEPITRQALSPCRSSLLGLRQGCLMPVPADPVAAGWASRPLMRPTSSCVRVPAAWRSFSVPSSTL